MKKLTKISFERVGRDGVDVEKSLTLITRVLGRGNRSDAIRISIMQTAEHIRLSQSTQKADK